eukprot:EG_transcript_12259
MAAEAVVARLVRKHLKVGDLRRSPGVAVHCVVEGKVVLSKAWGMANIKARRLMTPDTVFDLASVAKQLTAACVLRLGVAVHSPAHLYVPQFRQPFATDVTVYHLLHHTSGLPDYVDWEEDVSNVSLQDFVTVLNRQPPNKPPGTEYRYNNTNYCLLARLVECVSGLPFSIYLQRNVFGPLGMTSSFAVDTASPSQPDSRRGQRAEGYAESRKKGVVVSRSDVLLVGDGNVFASASDLGRLLAALRSAWLLPRDAQRVLFTPGRLSTGKQVGDGYACGWMITSIDDEPDAAAQHSGSWYGTSTAVRYYLKQDRTLICLSNDETLDSMALLNDIDCVLDGEEADDEEEEEEDEDEEDEEDG